MKFGVFFEIQYPRPWLPGGRQKLFQECLDQVELADRLGFDFVWVVEHHFLEEYAELSAPEIFLAAASQRTKRIRLAHGIVLMPPIYNPTARVAERIATLDLVSNGRVEFGTGESASRGELEGYGVPLDKKREMWRECTEQVANMLAMEPYPGYQGKYLNMPCRNVIPKPVQKPHPPMWMAAGSHDAFRMAGELGLGALGIAIVPPTEVKKWIDEYYTAIKTTCVPIGHTVNPNVTVVNQCSLDKSEERARQKGLDGSLYFSYAVAHHYAQGVHKPAHTNLWDQFQAVRHLLEKTNPPGQEATAIGTPEQCRRQVRGFAEAGADQVAFFFQCGKIKHEDSCESMHLFAKEVMPEFKEGEAIREAAKMERLRPSIEAALKRKRWMKPLSADEVPTYEPWPRPVAQKGARPKGIELDEESWEAASKKLIESLGMVPTGPKSGGQPQR